jgi:poly-beta-1,6-N-acetyl-D-glucosamine synthase
MSAHGRVLIVSAVRNERAHIERVVRAVARQTRPPDIWIVVDDGSDDGTLETLRSMQRGIPFMRVMEASPAKASSTSRDRLSIAAEARAWNQGLGAVDATEFAYVGKLDGDVELPPDYYEAILAKFSRDPRLGIAGGNLLERSGGRWRRLSIPPHHVNGALKLYSRACFEAIGGIQERLGWDTIDETYARMRGFATRSYTKPLALHHRPAASAGGVLRGRARHGETAYIVHYDPLWIGLRSLRVASMRPFVILGAALLYGYVRAAARRTPRVDDRDFRRYVRRELRRRLVRRPLDLERPAQPPRVVAGELGHGAALGPRRARAQLVQRVDERRHDRRPPE